MSFRPVSKDALAGADKDNKAVAEKAIEVIESALKSKNPELIKNRKDTITKSFDDIGLRELSKILSDFSDGKISKEAAMEAVQKAPAKPTVKSSTLPEPPNVAAAAEMELASKFGQAAQKGPDAMRQAAIEASRAAMAGAAGVREEVERTLPQRAAPIIAANIPQIQVPDLKNVHEAMIDGTLRRREVRGALVDALSPADKAFFEKLPAETQKHIFKEVADALKKDSAKVFDEPSVNNPDVLKSRIAKLGLPYMKKELGEIKPEQITAKKGEAPAQPQPSAAISAQDLQQNYSLASKALLQRGMNQINAEQAGQVVAQLREAGFDKFADILANQKPGHAGMREAARALDTAMQEMASGVSLPRQPAQSAFKAPGG